MVKLCKDLRNLKTQLVTRIMLKLFSPPTSFLIL